MKSTKKRCRFCRQWFMPDIRTRHEQYCCSNDLCQRKRRINSNRNWRVRHPGYDQSRKLKIQSWAKCYPNYWRNWRADHPEYVERDNRRRTASYYSSKISAKQNPEGNSAVDKLEAILSFLRKFSVKQDTIVRRLDNNIHLVSKTLLPQNKAV